VFKKLNERLIGIDWYEALKKQEEISRTMIFVIGIIIIAISVFAMWDVFIKEEPWR